MSRVIHFEVPTSDSAASVKFYENVLGWKITRWEGPMEYYLVETGPEGEPGINGGLGGAANEFKGTVNTVGVDDIDAVLKLVIENGGQIVMPRDEIPGVGLLAYVREPGGAVIGIIQSFPASGM
jgi:predicted enzyme related to lactoylglutathione lyase